MGSISTWGGGSPSKSTLKSYVHDAAELEFSLFRLQESRKKLKEKLDEAKREDPTRDIRVPRYETEIKPSKNLIPYRTPSPEEEEKVMNESEKTKKELSFASGCRGFVISIPLVIIGTIVSVVASVDIGAIFLVIGFVLPYVMSMYAKLTLSKKNAKLREEAKQKYHQELNEYNDEARRKNEEEERRYQSLCAQCAVENPKIRERNAQRRKDYEAACAKARVPHDRKIAMLEAQLSELDSAITRTTQDRERFYSVNIVPVDYRTIQCVFYLDHAFRNDLVDTVRQGIDRYELSEYRTAVLGGIYSIVSKLDQMTGLMRDLGHQLSSIQSEVSFMSNDLYNMAEEQSRKQTEIGNRILEESRLRRKITEELNENAERIARYCDSR